MDPVEDRQMRMRPGSGDSDSAVAVAGAIGRALVVLERHRRQSRREGSSGRPRQRYEERCLSAAIARLERYLRVAEEVTDAEGIRGWIEDALADGSVGRHLAPDDDVAWVSSRARRRANVKARKRFKVIAIQVIAEFERANLSEASKGHPEAPKAHPAAEPGRCTALTRRGTRCKNAAETDGLCGLHARLTKALVLVR